MPRNYFLLVKKLNNTESSQLCLSLSFTFTPIYTLMIDAEVVRLRVVVAPRDKDVVASPLGGAAEHLDLAPAVLLGWGGGGEL